MNTKNTTAGAPTATLAGLDLECLAQFAWLIDNAGSDRSAFRLGILWQWAWEMASFQREANRSGEPINYVQRGETLRVLLPQNVTEAA